MSTVRHQANASSSRLRLRVTAAAEAELRGGHPWLFADSIREQNRPGQLGELVVIYDRQDKFLAVGLFDPDSPLRVRVLHAGKPALIDRDWWTAQLRRARDRRKDLFDEQTTGGRWINGESDGWPGLVLDRYDQTLVMKLYTAAWLVRLELRPERIVLRLSRNVQDQARKQFGHTDGEVVVGEPLSGPAIFLESGLRFEADVVRGQKTGFFLDQRENRRRVEILAGGRTVLNAFSFSGGFSLYAARGGARAVTDLDLSAHALAAAERNFALNQSDAVVAACRHDVIQAEAFEWLAGNSERLYDLIVLDPPSLAKREAERVGALGAYTRLAALAIQHLRPDGILVACSCSAHVSAEEFFVAVRAGTARSNASIEEIGTFRHAPDHPATFKEAEYLKAIFLKRGRT
jgi:23S rRNA (cytosine1962-C5)-methyltransferase